MIYNVTILSWIRFNSNNKKSKISYFYKKAFPSQRTIILVKIVDKKKLFILLVTYIVKNTSKVNVNHLRPQWIVNKVGSKHKT